MKKRKSLDFNNLPTWVIPHLRLYYDTAIVPYRGKMYKKKIVQKQDVINALIAEYHEKAPVTKQGLDILYTRAENRGYMPIMIYIGLKTMICKNYVRNEYIPPNNDPMQEVIHNRIYAEDWEFRSVFK